VQPAVVQPTTTSAAVDPAAAATAEPAKLPAPREFRPGERGWVTRL
jgi:hypothetical protein